MINDIVDSFFADVGIVVIALWLLGTADIIDFKLCISPAGTCSVEVRK